MADVTIGADTFTVYIEQADAVSYLNGSITSAATAFLAASNDTQARAIVSAGRWLDSIAWLGDKNDAAQTIQWPRSGTGVTGVEDDAIPLDIQYACAELAALLISDTDLQQNFVTAQSSKRLKAGSVEIEYFRNLETGNSTAVPVFLLPLIRPYMASSVAFVGSFASGTDRESSLEEYGLNQGI